MMVIGAAIIQMRSGISPDDNFDQAETLIRQAAGDGAQLIATPENTGLMQRNRAKMLARIKPEADDELLVRFCALAKELSVFLAIGSLAIRVAPDKAANRSFLISPDGEITARYDKIHLFDVAVNAAETWSESDHIAGGNKAVLANAGNVRLGLSICYDLRFAALYQRLAAAGAEVLMVPAAFTRITGRAHWRTLLGARAIETGSYVLAAAQGGVHEDGRRTWGHSMIVDPWGKLVAAFDHDRPGVLLADLDLELVASIRKRMPVLEQAVRFTGP